MVFPEEEGGWGGGSKTKILPWVECRYFMKHYTLSLFPTDILSYLADLPELEKVIVAPFVGKADEIDLSNIPYR